MTPKEKAKEMVDKFRKWEDDSGCGWNIECAKDCARIAVDEIRSSNPCTNENEIEGLKGKWHMMYWQYVKEEIEKL